MLHVLTLFLSNRSQYVVVDGCRSKLVNVVSGVHQDSVLTPSSSSCTPRSFSQCWRTSFYGYANDSTLVEDLSSPSGRVAVRESLNRDLNIISKWCNLWGMKLNANKTNTMIFSRSRTIQPHSILLPLNGIVLKKCNDLVLLGVTFDALMLFALIPKQQLRGLVPSESPVKYFMIYRLF